MSPHEPKSIVGYVRVSTQKQGRSGLGQEAQEAALKQFARERGAKILKVYVEIESGKRDDRPELEKAIGHAKRSRALLAVAKLDRLSRNAAFLLSLQSAGVEFVAVDNPHVNRVTIGILAVMAEWEAEQISKRTKEALQAYKARGKKLGAQLPQCRNLKPKDRKLGAKRAGETAKREADEAYRDLIPFVCELREEGATYREIAATLNEEGHTTRHGKDWNPVQVMRVLQRAKALAA